VPARQIALPDRHSAALHGGKSVIAALYPPGVVGYSSHMSRLMSVQSPDAGSQRGLRVVHLSYDGIQSAFHAQTVGLVQALRTSGVSAGIVVFSQPGWEASFGPIAHREGGSEYPCHVFWRPPLLGSANLGLAASRMAPLIASLSRERRPIVLHCRGPLGTSIGIRLRNALGRGRVRVVFDARGLVVDEIAVLAGRHPTAGRLRNRLAIMMSRRRATLVRGLESEACLRADALTSVSQSLGRELASRHGLLEDRFTVVPTSTAFAMATGGQLRMRRENARGRLGLHGKTVVAYNGSMHPWQEPDDLVRAFESCRRARANSHFLVLTMWPEVAQRVLTAHAVSSHEATVLKLSHDEVALTLPAADAGLLLRRPSPVNKVACPIKFAEYVACGVPVITSRGIGDLDGLVTRWGLGTLVDSPEAAGAALSGLRLNADGAATALAEYFSWRSAVASLTGVYQEALDAGER